MVILILSIAILILIACFAIFLFFYSQVKRNQRQLKERPGFDDKSSREPCARCRQYRVIVNKDAGLCAFCWSSMRTKQLG